ncbi:MAG: uncharacterized membrane protein YraQ (UPF0718 family)/copper chaperone CopZ [Myxococcota bacterium]|jgi:uncharacterized membrane protein YraQ (UPF0718 family)/copper chaperone CopZ
MTFATALLDIVLELAPWLLLGTAIASALHVLLPRDLVHRHLGRGGFGSVAKAVLLGVPLPLCSCGVIPAGLGLKHDGASDGAAVGFLISTPQTGVDSILVSGAFLGWPFALFKVLAAAVTGLVGGALTDLGQPPTPAPPPLPAAAAGMGGFREAWSYAVDELLYPIWHWLAFGIAVSAAITAFVPAGALAETVAGSGALALFGALLISLPLYVCATSSVPIAAALVHAGMPAGAALVFLMAGPASNIATIGAVSKGFGPRVLAIYLGTIVLGSVGFGLAFDAAFGLQVADIVHAHEHSGPVAWASAAALAGLLGYYAVSDLGAAVRRLRPAPVTAEILVLPVDGMSCGGCARKVTAGLSAAAGVEDVQVDLEAKTATVRGSQLRQPDLEQAVVDAGFTVRAAG